MSMVGEELIEEHVPVREGDYGERVAAVEPGGVEYIPERERHGKPLNLFWTWVSPNMEFATVFIGVLPIAAFGMGFWDATVAIVLGTLLGSITHAVLSSWGPKFGVPQLVQSRAAFGFLGNILPAGLNAFTGMIGWFIVNSVSGAFALSALFGPSVLKWFTMPFWLAFLIIVVAQVAVAFIGHNFIHSFERYVFPYLTIVFLIACGIVFAKANFATGIDAKVQGPLGESGAFTLSFTAAFGYAVGWNPYASDYTRYLPRRSSRLAAGLWAGLGVALSCIVLEEAGNALATFANIGNLFTNPTAEFVKPLPLVLAALTLIAISIGTVAANALNIYSGAMSFLALGIRLPLTLRRAIVALASGVLGYAIGVAGQANVGPGSKYEDFLLLISYWIAPFLAVVMVDYLLRRGNFGDEELFYDTRHNTWKGFVAMAAAIIVSVPFWNNTLYTGPIAHGNPALGDITFIVGFVVAAVLYFAFNAGRSPAPAAEEAAQAA